VLHVLAAVTGRRAAPAWHLAPAGQFQSVWSERAAATLDRLGFIPLTRHNMRALLDIGQAVIVHPEPRPSFPPYGLRRFDPMICDMAAQLRVPVVPVVLVGTHESHIMIEAGDSQMLLNPAKPLRADFAIRFLPPLRAAEPEAIREAMQAAIDELVERRPRVRLVRLLQRRFGDPPHLPEADALPAVT
jgi:1-acyl-sn-glycerol-3-phosphate acyltransferase